MRIDIGARRVDEIDTEHAITLRFKGGATIRIESPVQISGLDRGTIMVDPQELRSDQDVQHAGLGRVAESVFADDDSGALRITFEGGITWEVAPDPDFEPWTASWPDGTTVVSLPGGGLSTWSAQL